MLGSNHVSKRLFRPVNSIKLIGDHGRWWLSNCTLSFGPWIYRFPRPSFCVDCYRTDLFGRWQRGSMARLHWFSSQIEWSWQRNQSWSESAPLKPRAAPEMPPPAGLAARQAGRPSAPSPISHVARRGNRPSGQSPVGPVGPVGPVACRPHRPSAPLPLGPVVLQPLPRVTAADFQSTLIELIRQWNPTAIKWFDSNDWRWRRPFFFLSLSFIYLFLFFLLLLLLLLLLFLLFLQTFSNSFSCSRSSPRRRRRRRKQIDESGWRLVVSLERKWKIERKRRREEKRAASSASHSTSCLHRTDVDATASLASFERFTRKIISFRADSPRFLLAASPGAFAISGVDPLPFCGSSIPPTSTTPIESFWPASSCVIPRRTFFLSFIRLYFLSFFFFFFFFFFFLFFYSFFFFPLLLPPHLALLRVLKWRPKCYFNRASDLYFGNSPPTPQLIWINCYSPPSPSHLPSSTSPIFPLLHVRGTWIHFLNSSDFHLASIRWDRIPHCRHWISIPIGNSVD